jgi:hypothetical protein
VSVAGLPGKVAGAVLEALGSSTAEQDDVAWQTARLFVTTCSAPSRPRCIGCFSNLATAATYKPRQRA